MRNLLTKFLTGLPGLLLAGASPSWGCPVCRPRVQAAIYNQHYLPTVLLVLLPVLLLAAGGLGLYFLPRLTLWKTPLPRPLPMPAPHC